MTENAKFNRFAQRPILTLLALLLIFSFSLFVLVELYFRLVVGENPASTYFKKVDQLEVYDSFFTDEEGIYKANKLSHHHVEKGIAINSDGFRSQEFAPDHSSNTSILFLGDSFTWGASADPITHSFPDVIATRGFTVYNTGIPGVGPAQYAHVGEKYIPVLKPDVVALMFYLGNDLQLMPDPMIPHQNLWHVTNAGMLSGFDDDGRPLSALEAYRFYVRKEGIKHEIKQVLMTTVLGSKFVLSYFSLKRGIKRVLDVYVKEGTSLKSITETTRDAILRVKKASEKAGATFRLFLIPVNPLREQAHNSIDENIFIFDGLDPMYPENLTEDDYTPHPDDHFTNSGHAKMAHFILGILHSGT